MEERKKNSELPFKLFTRKKRDANARKEKETAHRYAET